MYLGTQPAIGQNRKLDSIAASFNGVLTTFSLTVNTQSVVPSNVYQLFISLGGVLQDPGVDFTANGNQITFTTAPVSGLTFFGVFQGDSITGTPTIADASITTLKLATGLTITNTAGTAGAPSVTFAGDTNTGIYSPGADQVAITTGGTGRLFIDSSGRLLVGTSTARSNFFGTTLSSLTQTEGTGGSTARGSLSVINNDVSNNPPYVLLGRSGAATIGSNAAVVNGSRLGTLTFHGADGTSFIEAATVAGEVDGTPGSNDMPGRLVFSTTSDNAGSPTERMRLDSSGRLGLGTSSPQFKCVVSEQGTGVTSTLAIRAGEGGSGSTNNNAQLYFRIRGGGPGDVDGFIQYIYDGSNYVLKTEALGGHQWSVNGTERARIDSSGRLLVGTSTASSADTSKTEIYGGGIDNTDGGGNQVLLRKNEFTAGNQTAHMLRLRSGLASQGQMALGLLTNAGGQTLGFIDQVSGVGTIFAQGGTERMRITSGGSIYIANTAGGGGSYAGYGGEVFAVRSAGNTSLFWTEGTANNGVAIQGARGTNGFVCAWFNNGTKVGDISVTASATAYNTGSDYRLKENVISLTGAIDRLNQLQVHRFNFITDPDKTVDGFIAHEAQAVVPECVTGEKDAVNDEGNPVYQGIDQSKLVPLLTAALQEAIGRIETLEAEVAALKGA